MADSYLAFYTNLELIRLINYGYIAIFLSKRRKLNLKKIELGALQKSNNFFVHFFKFEKKNCISFILSYNKET